MTIIANNVVAILNTAEEIVVSVRDSDNLPISATNLALTVYDTGSQVFIPAYTTAARILNPSLGSYSFTLGSPPFSSETSTSQDLLFQWSADGQPTTIQIVSIVSVPTMMIIGRFQDQIDKSHKDVEEDPDNPIFLGYTTWQLFAYLLGGLGIINSYQPFPTWISLDSFPMMLHGQILIDAGMLIGIQSQELYAIDTDIDPAFSNQGNSFSIAHYPKLEAFANSLWQRLDKLVPQMKLHFVNSGMIHIEAGPSYRLAALLAAAPGGSIFRNGFVAETQTGLII